MYKRLVVTILVMCCIGAAGYLEAATDRCLMPTTDSPGPVDICSKVYRLTCKPGNRIFSGFDGNVEGVPGIITALHGVAGCNKVLASNLSDSFSDLRLAKVNIRKDLAFLTSSKLKSASKPALRIDSGFMGRGLRVVGYPQAVIGQKSHELAPQPDPTEMLRFILSPGVIPEFEKRNSPHPDEIVLSLTGALQHGYSGGPVLTEDGTVVAVADGGLGEGAYEIGWAIPVQQVRWDDPDKHTSFLSALGGKNSGKLFGVSPAPIAKLPDLYFTDARDSRGRIYKLANGNVSEFYVRPRGNIYYIAVSKNGTVFFSNANDRHLYRLRGKKEELVYTHKTYLRDIAFDQMDRLYFSEATGAGGDGFIYRLEGKQASFYYRVRLKDVDGSWAGNFAFDKDGFLWLSSGNRKPAHLYRVIEQRPRRVFTSSDSIEGLSFIADNILIYADWRHSIRRLDLPGYLSSDIQSFGTIQWLADVEPVKGFKMVPLRLAPKTTFKQYVNHSSASPIPNTV